MGYIPPGLALLPKKAPGAKQINTVRLAQSAKNLHDEEVVNIVGLSIVAAIFILGFGGLFWYIFTLQG